MSRIALSGLMLSMLLMSISTLAINIQPVRAGGTIYIRADGSIDPPTANIITVDNVTYTFTDSNYDEVVVERGNIMVDGCGYTLQGSRSGNGFYVQNVNNVTIQNTNIKYFSQGVYLHSSSSNTVHRNNITNNDYGVFMYSSSLNVVSGNNILSNKLDGVRISSSSNNNVLSGNDIANNIWLGVALYKSSSNNTVSGNNIENNWEGGIWLSTLTSPSCTHNKISENNIHDNWGFGVRLEEASSLNTISKNNITNNPYSVVLHSSSNNLICHNNFIYNPAYSYASVNTWDDGYPNGGNYWSDYEERYPDAQELDGSGIWDTPYVIDSNNQDNYPLMEPWPRTPTHACYVYLDPKITYALPGESYVIAVKVADVEYLYSWQVRLDYNTDVLTYVNMTEGDFLRDQPEGTYHPPPRIEEEDGWIFFGWSTVGKYLGVSGSGTLATVEFVVDGVGESLLDIDHSMTKLFEILPPPVPPGEPPYREIPHTRENAVFINSIEPPTADFTLSPSLPARNQPVTFDASASSAAAPNVIDELHWDFGDGTTETYVRGVNLTYTTTHVYTTAGTYLVTLTVIDNATATELIEAMFGTTTMPDIWYELYSTQTASIEIVEIIHDIAIVWVVPSETVVTVGETVSISVTALNKGTGTETFVVTAYYGDSAIETKQVTDLEPEEEETLVFNWDTTGVEIGTYLIWAEAIVEEEGNPEDNTFIDGTVTLVAPPSIYELVETIESWHLHKGTEKSLIAKLKVAGHMLDMGKEDGAIRKLNAFIHRVQRLRGKTLTNEQADYLETEAQRIIDFISG